MRHRGQPHRGVHRCLNPYYNGKYSMSPHHAPHQPHERLSLNPYYNGKYSMSV